MVLLLNGGVYMKRTVWYINATANGGHPPWVRYDGFITTASPMSHYVEHNTKYPYCALHMATKSDGKPRDKGQWTAFYRWDAKKGKFVCTRYRDVLRKQRRTALLASLKQDLDTVQS